VYFQAAPRVLPFWWPHDSGTHPGPPALQHGTQAIHSGGCLISTEPRVNDRIRAKEVRLVAPDGSQVGIKSIDEARWLADNLGLDLVEVAADARPPVVRMMDYGKFKYEQSVKAREARKKQTRTVIKEVQFRPKIGKSDFDVKRLRVERFLKDHDKVKVTMRFRGREVTHPEIGRDILKRLAESVEELGVVEQMPRLDGKQMTMVIAPLKREEMPDEPRPAKGKPTKRKAAAADAAEAPPEPESTAAVAVPEAPAAPEAPSDGEALPAPEAAPAELAGAAGTVEPDMASGEPGEAADTAVEVAAPPAEVTSEENTEETG
jgi:translation initiation factor IF-3